MKKDLTEIVFLLDRSGSMAGLEEDTIGGFNAFIERQNKLEEETLLTAILFDDSYEILWNGINTNNVKLTNREYFVRGMTALLDAVGKTILDVENRLSRTSKVYQPGKVIFVITTDGMENASSEFTYKKVKELIKRQQAKYDWQFIFMGANMDAAEEADQIGISKEHAYDFEASTSGVKVMYEKVSEMVADKRKK